MRTQKNKKRFTKNKKRITKNKKRINGGENTKKDKNINNNVTLNNFRAKKIRCSPKVLNELNIDPGSTTGSGFLYVAVCSPTILSPPF